MLSPTGLALMIANTTGVPVEVCHTYTNTHTHTHTVVPSLSPILQPERIFSKFFSLSPFHAVSTPRLK